MDVSIVIPAWNEQRRLPAVLGSLASHLRRAPAQAEIIVVDYGSLPDAHRAYQAMARGLTAVPIRGCLPCCARLSSGAWSGEPADVGGFRR